jgi:hypothetical protein
VPITNNKFKADRNSIFYSFILVLFASILLIAVNDPCHPYDLNKLFPDSYDYLAQAKMSIFSFNFWFPVKVNGFSPRPFTVPLIYKIIGGDVSVIIIWQKIIHFVSAFILCISVSLFIKKTFLKYLLSVFICIVFCWWNILGWSQLILSESLSFSFTFIWISSLLLWVKFNTRLTFLVHVISMLLLLFIRDSWSYVLIFFYLLGIITAYIYSKNLLKPVLAILVICCLAFVVQQKSIVRGERQKIPIVNNLVVRIIKDSSYLQYFTDKGMPFGAELRKEYYMIDFNIHENRVLLYELYDNTKYKPLFDWVVRNGKNTYMSFMLTHPSYPLMINEPSNKLNSFFIRNLYQYTNEPIGISLHVEFVFPVFSYLALLIFVILLTIINMRLKNLIYILFTVLYITFIANAIIIYNADSLETDRHLFNDSIFVEILGAIFFCFILDSLSYQRIISCLKAKKDKAMYCDMS